MLAECMPRWAGRDLLRLREEFKMKCSEEEMWRHGKKFFNLSKRVFCPRHLSVIMRRAARTTLSSTGYGVAVRQGTPSPANPRPQAPGEARNRRRERDRAWTATKGKKWHCFPTLLYFAHAAPPASTPAHAHRHREVDGGQTRMESQCWTCSRGRAWSSVFVGDRERDGEGGKARESFRGENRTDGTKAVKSLQWRLETTSMGGHEAKGWAKRTRLPGNGGLTEETQIRAAVDRKVGRKVREILAGSIGEDAEWRTKADKHDQPAGR
ncbi:hypothetical protein B0H14DRAFT_2586668 [Mycena olivaceomarginata]|nr:hypothetical protein B0H14DRAFT_2586668 [Mycena olivaceomarginata]